MLRIHLKGFSRLRPVLLCIVYLFIWADVRAGEPTWEDALAAMRKGSEIMADGLDKIKDKKNFAAGEKTVREGHRMMMDAERSMMRIEREMMLQGAQKMIDGLEVMKRGGDPEGLMLEGRQRLEWAAKRMKIREKNKLMQGSRTMMRGLRLLQDKDVAAAHKLMSEGQKLMNQAEAEIKEKERAKVW